MVIDQPHCFRFKHRFIQSSIFEFLQHVQGTIQFGDIANLVDDLHMMLNISKKTFEYVVNVVFLGLELGQCQCRWVHVTYIESFHDIYGVAIGFETMLMVCCAFLYIKFFTVFGAVLSFLVDQECDEAFVECMFGAIGKR